MGPNRQELFRKQRCLDQQDGSPEPRTWTSKFASPTETRLIKDSEAMPRGNLARQSDNASMEHCIDAS